MPALHDHLPCLLCGNEAAWFCAFRERGYYRCACCELLFVDPASHLPPERERAIYDLHQNDAGDPRYRAFLARLAEPLLHRLAPGMRGLDFGCGPGPVLGMMLRERGMSVADYDPLYAADADLLERDYDFVTCTEVVEHFRDPLEGWRRLHALLKPAGWLGVMTQLAPPDVDGFRRWRYKDDDTHVALYRPATLEWLAAELGFALEVLDERVMLLQRRA